MLEYPFMVWVSIVAITATVISGTVLYFSNKMNRGENVSGLFPLFVIGIVLAITYKQVQTLFDMIWVGNPDNWMYVTLTMLLIGFIAVFTSHKLYNITKEKRNVS